MRRWRQEAKLGYGKFGVVYACLHQDEAEGTQPSHAIKKLQKIWVDIEQVRKRFAREIDILASLDHHNVMSVVDSGASRLRVASAWRPNHSRYVARSASTSTAS